MGRSRRRNRRALGPRGLDLIRHSDGGAGAVATETLAPRYVPVGEAWDMADMEAPVLALDGLEPWEEIKGPALLLEEQPATDDGSRIESSDPWQLELTAVAGAGAALGDAAREGPGGEPAGDGASAGAAVEEAPPEPDPVELVFDQARESWGAGRTEEAKRLFRQVLGARAGHVRARNNLALLLDASGDHATALAELDRALEDEPDNPTVLVNRGALLGAQGRFAAAERDLRRVLRVEPSHAEALFNLGVVMTKKGLWAEAVPHLRRAIELEPGRAAAHFYLGEALNHVDDLTGAMLAYQRAAELQPNHPRALYGLGIVYDRLGRPDDAAQMYRRSREVGGR